MVSRAEALSCSAARGETYKVEIIESIPEGEEISYFQHGDFIDLCRGPHVERTGDIKAFKVLSFAGAYWRGDERNRAAPARLRHGVPVAGGARRAPGTASKRPSAATTATLGKSSISSRSTTWSARASRSGTRRGRCVRYQIEDFIRRENVRRGYELVYTPHVAREQLLETSGHLAHYKENLFGGMELEGQRYLVKPMNCPFHVAIYRSQMRSYRDLPLRYSELGTVYRYERSGVLHGLLRVRGFTMDDAHLFVREDQIGDEMAGCLTFALDMLELFGFEDFDLFLATRPESFMGEPAAWDRAEAALRGVLEATGPAVRGRRGRRRVLRAQDRPQDQGRARPRVAVRDVPARLPAARAVRARVRRARTGTRQRPVMIHRALLGSIERFIAVLIEHYAGAFPLWLAPVQARVLSVSEKAEAYAHEVAARLRAEGLRVEADVSADKLGAKIRKAQLEKIPYMLVVGEKDMAARVVSPRTREKASSYRRRRSTSSRGGWRRGKTPSHPERPSGITMAASYPAWRNKPRTRRKIIARPFNSSPLERDGQLPRQPPHPRARGARHRRRRQPARRHPHARSAAHRRGAGPRAGRGQPARRAAGLQDHGLRQVQVRDVEEGEGLAQAPVDDRAQGDQAPAQDRRARLRLQGEAHPPLPVRGEQVQAGDRLPRPRDRPPRDGAGDARAGGRGGERHRDGRAARR